MSEQPSVSNVHPIQREGTRFDEIVDHQIDLHSYTAAPYNSGDIKATLQAVETKPELHPVRIAAQELANLAHIRESAKRIEERKFLAEDVAA